MGNRSAAAPGAARSVLVQPVPAWWRARLDAARDGLGRRGDRGGGVALAAVAYIALCGLWIVSGVGGAEVRALGADLVFVPLQLILAGLAVRAARHPDLDRSTRRAWLLLAAGAFGYWVGDVGWVFVSLNREPHLVSWTDIPYLASYAFTLAGLLTLPSVVRTGQARLKFGLDAGATLVGGGLVLWFVVLKPAGWHDDQDWLANLVALAYPTLDMLGLFTAITVLLRHPPAGTRTAVRWCVVGFFAYACGDAAFGALALAENYRSGEWPDVLWLVGYGAFILAADAQHRYAGAGQRWRPPRSGEDRLESYLPYLAAVGGYGLLLVDVANEAPPQLLVLVPMATAVVVLLLARQAVELRERARLLVLQQSEARFTSLVRNSSDVILVVDDDATIRYVTPSVERVFGYRTADHVDTPLDRYLHPDDADMARDHLRTVAGDEGVSAPFEWRVRRADGEWRHVEVLACNLVHDPNVAGLVLHLRDISERKALEARLSHQAYHDPLTDLANRDLLEDRLDQVLRRSRRLGAPAALLFVDLDNFKSVNDGLGHAAGDSVLRTAADRLRRSVREVDTVARWGGDEFAVLLEPPMSVEQATRSAERITASLSLPIELADRTVLCPASTGVVVSDGAHQQPDDLLRAADAAMYAAKARGKGRYVVFEPAMEQAAARHHELEADLRSALGRGELRLHYQPLVNLATGVTVGAEALLRWQHPRRGLLSPDEFIPIAEATGLIVPIGAWVLAAACRQVRAWQTAHRPAGGLGLAVNLAAAQVQSPELVDAVTGALAAGGLPPTDLTLELTESAMVADWEAARDRLGRLKARGVRVALDDFGTGYSFLSHLQHLPIDVLKIDRAFVEQIGAPAAPNTGLVETVVALARTLRLSTVAEGVETAAQAAALCRLGCRVGQGYFYARPLPPEAFGARLAAETAARPAPMPVSPGRLGPRAG